MIGDELVDNGRNEQDHAVQEEHEGAQLGDTAWHELGQMREGDHAF